jgi:hypothetical protein
MAARPAPTRSKASAAGAERSKSAKQHARGVGVGSGALATIAIVVVTLLAVTALPLCLLLLAGLIPTMVASMMDRFRAKYLTWTVGAMNLAGIAPLAFRLWSDGFTVRAAIDILLHPVSWLMMYGAAAIGWTIFLAMPSVARTFVDVRADHLQHQLKARAKLLVAEWGEEVTGQAKRD